MRRCAVTKVSCGATLRALITSFYNIRHDTAHPDPLVVRHRCAFVTTYAEKQKYVICLQRAFVQ